FEAFVGDSIVRGSSMLFDRFVTDALLVALGYFLPHDKAELPELIMHTVFMAFVFIVIRDVAYFWREGLLKEKFFGHHSDSKSPDAQVMTRMERLEAARERAMSMR